MPPSTPVSPAPSLRGQLASPAAVVTAGVHLRQVKLVVGRHIQVQGDSEVEWFNATRDKYLLETKFTEATDLRDLDRLLILELMVYRWTVHLAAGVDYDGLATNDEQLRKNIREYSDQINKVKSTMGLNKAAREEADNDGNFATYLANLKARAKLFGVHRERQLTKALTLTKELFTIVGAYDRSDAEERRKLGFESETEILDWVREVFQPEFDAIDAYFREHEQRYWIRDQ